MTDWGFGPGLVPNVQPGDIRNALAMLLPSVVVGKRES